MICFTCGWLMEIYVRYEGWVAAEEAQWLGRRGAAGCLALHWPCACNVATDAPAVSPQVHCVLTFKCVLAGWLRGRSFVCCRLLSLAINFPTC